MEISMKDCEIGLSQWSFHRSILGNSREDYDQYLSDLHSDNPDIVLRGEVDHVDLLNIASELGVKTIDLVNILFFSKVDDYEWLRNWRRLADEKQITFHCLMCDELGNIGASSEGERQEAVEKHILWLQAAATLGCKMLRVNAYGDGTYLQQLKSSTRSLTELAQVAASLGMDIVVENHGHPSSNAGWLAMLIESVDMKNVGVYLDFDNFFMGGWHHDPKRYYDRTQGIEDLAPYTFGVSAKSYEFSGSGEETTVNFSECMEILRRHGFSGVLAAEYEGDVHSEMEGTAATIELLRRYTLTR